MKNLLAGVAALVLLSSEALAQPSPPQEHVVVRLDGGIPPVVIYCASTSDLNAPVAPCSLGSSPGGAGAGGAVTESGNWQVNLVYGGGVVGPTNLLGVTDKTLDTLIGNGTALPVSVSNFPTTQQVGGSVSVSNLPATQAVSASSLPLPAGAATSALESSIVTALGSPLQAGGSVSVSNFPATQPVSAASLPLPAGAATSALESSIVTALGSPLQAGGAVSVSNFPATQTVAGMVGLSGSLTATAYDPPQVTLGTTSTTIVPATTGSAPRMRAFLVNVSSANTAWCRADGGTAAVGVGIPLVYNTGSYQYNYPSAGTAAINCICNAASCPISVEYVQ